MRTAVAASNLRRRISEKVLKLRKLENYIDVLDIDRELIDQYLKNGFSKNPTPSPLTKSQIVDDINLMFNMGGVISGGAALSIIKEYPIKDIDFYFNDELNYIKAYLLTFNNPHIDICWYFDRPHELHDMSYVMCNVHPGDKIEITPQAQEALNSGISDLYMENFIWPEKTAERMIKYNKKYGVKFKKHQVLAMIGIYKFSPSLAKSLLALTV